MYEAYDIDEICSALKLLSTTFFEGMYNRAESDIKQLGFMSCFLLEIISTRPNMNAIAVIVDIAQEAFDLRAQNLLDWKASNASSIPDQTFK